MTKNNQIQSTKRCRVAQMALTELARQAHAQAAMVRIEMPLRGNRRGSNL